MEENGQLHGPATLSSEKTKAGNHYIEGSVGVRVSMNVRENRKTSCSYQE
jgi:hypothetical protein